MYPNSMDDSPIREVPDNGPGSFFELYSATYTYKPKRGAKLSKQEKSAAAIIGLVPDKYVPSEGGTFKMYHHKTGGIMHFGAIKLEECANVVEEDGSYYFESSNDSGRYILIPWTQFN